MKIVRIAVARFLPVQGIASPVSPVRGSRVVLENSTASRKLACQTPFGGLRDHEIFTGKCNN